MVPKARAIALRMVEKHRLTDLLTPTPQQVSEVFDALPEEFARHAGIPVEEITEMARAHTAAFIDDRMRRNLFKWQTCAYLYLSSRRLR